MLCKCFKGFIAMFMAVFLLWVFGNPASAANTEEIPVFLNGKLMQFEVPAVIVQGRTMVPLRAIFEALGAGVEWNPNDRSIEAVRNGTTIGLVVDSAIAVKNGIEVPLDAPAMILDNRTMVPLRFVSEALGETVVWDPVGRQVYITKENGTPTPALNGYGVPDANGPFRNVDPEWVASLIYEHELVYPHSISIGPGGDAFVYDRAKGSIYKISRSNHAISEYKDLKEYFQPNTPEGVNCIAWQPGAERFLIGTQNGQIWYYEPNKDEVGILSPGLPEYKMGWNYFEVNPADDSFFATSHTPIPEGRIYRFNADMTAELIVSGTHGAYQSAYVGSENALYFTETYPGTMKKVDLETLAVTSVMSNIGIPRTFEPIPVAFNHASGVINVYDVINGLVDVSGNVIVRPDSGVGTMCWWDAAGDRGAMIMLQNAGANIIFFDIAAGGTRPLTSYVNAQQIARNKAGEVLIDSPDEYGSYIAKIDASGISEYYRDSGAALRVLMNDTNGNVYAAWSDGKINIITGPGTDNAQAWTDGVTNVIGMAHNKFLNKIVVLRQSAPNIVEIVNIDCDDPTSRNTLATIQTIGDVPHRGNVVCGNDDGAVYVSFCGVSAPGRTSVLRFDSHGNRSFMNIQPDIWDGSDMLTFLSAVVYARKMPGLVYVRDTDKLLASTLKDINAYPGGGETLSSSTFAVSNGAVDIFAMTEDKEGRIIGMHSGRVFQFELK